MLVPDWNYGFLEYLLNTDIAVKREADQSTCGVRFQRKYLMWL